MNRLQGTCAGLAALLGAAVLPAAADPAPDTWHGGSVDVIVADPGPVPAGLVEYDEDVAGVLPGVGWANVFGYELRGRTGPYQYGTSATTGAHWCVGSERFADARIAVPHNVSLTFFRMWGFDGSTTEDITAFLFESCLPSVSAGTPVNTVLQEIGSTGDPGAFSVVGNANSPATDLLNCTYHVRVRFGANCAGGGQTTVRKLRVQYSPPAP